MKTCIKTTIYTIFIRIDAPGAKTKFSEGAAFKRTPIFMLM